MLILGVDVSKDRLALALWREGTAEALEAVPNSLTGWEQLTHALVGRVSSEALPQLEVVLEPTGGYELAFALWAFQRGWPVHRPHPARVREWARRKASARQDGPAGCPGVGALWSQPIPARLSAAAQ